MVRFATLAATHVVFWTVAQPVNRHWLANTNLTRAAERFFSTFSSLHAPGRIEVRSRNSAGAGIAGIDDIESRFGIGTRVVWFRIRVGVRLREFWFFRV